jgi:hypothetical protein
MKLRLTYTFVLFALLLSACAPAATDTAVPASATSPADPPAPPAADTPVPSATPVPAETATPAPTATPTLTLPTIDPALYTPSATSLPADYWGGWPIVPAVTGRVMEIYRQGILMGNDPYAFSAVGDCQSMPNVFLGIYETDRYNLGSFDYLQSTIDHFRGSFNRKSAAVKDGMSVASVLSPMWNDPEQCEADETPIECELRVHRPSFVFINLGTNWKNGGPTAYEKYLRQVVQIVIDHGAVPILSTKADNIEGDHSLNVATARVAYDLNLPLYNFWLASNDMENHGLDSSREDVYLTPDAWDRRNFYALVTLDTLWNGLKWIYDPGPNPASLGSPTPVP